MVDIRRKSEAAMQRIFIGILGCVLGCPTLTSAQGPVPGIVVFGDSLSDSGNAFALAGGTNTPPDYAVDFFIVPDKPYARGGHHFSNGPTWIEQFAKSIGLTANARPAFRGSNPGATNYAVGGARARSDGGPGNLAEQVERFLQDFGGVAPSGALYVVEIGGNDLRDAAALEDPNIIGGALTAIAANISNLYAAGARKFLIWNVPKLAISPAIRKADALVPGTAWFIDVAVNVPYNSALEGLLGNLEQTLPGSQIYRFDAYASIAAIHDQGANYGLTEVELPCITPNVAPFFCQKPDDYLFWDGIHPTKAAHAIFANEVAQLLAQ